MPSSVPPPYVQVAPDSTGKRVVNVSIAYDNGDGTTTSYYTQGVVLLDGSGLVVRDLATSSDIAEVLGKLDELIEAVRELGG